MSDIPSRESILGAGAATAPGSGVTIATVALPATTAVSGITPFSRYQVWANVHQEGTVDTTHMAAVSLSHGSTVLGPVATGAGDAMVGPIEVEPGADTDISLKTTAVFGASSIVVGQIIATRVG